MKHMKSMNKKLIRSLAACLLLVLTNCKDILDQAPLTAPVAETFYSNEMEAIQAINAIYDVLNGTLYRGGNPVAFAMMEDHIYKGTNPNDAFGLSQINALNIEPLNPWVFNWYQGLYQGINRANVALEKIPSISVPDKISEATKKRLLAEATFLRGLYYFYLVRLYGDVPIVLQSPTDLQAPGTPKAPEAEVWAQVEKDFKEAIPGLPSAYPASETGRATSGAVKSFLAQVYMWQNQPAKALPLLEEVITSNVYQLEPQFIDNFLETNVNSKEAVFAIQYKNLGSTAESATWIKNIGVRQQRPLVEEPGFGFLVGTKEVLNNYDAGDVRRGVTFWEFGKPNPNNPTGPKYNATLSSPFHLNTTDVGPMKWWWANNGYPTWGGPNLALIRFADVLLYHAEASNAVNGPNASAYASINKVRARAKVPELPSGLNKQGFFEAVLRERRAEFMFEFQRWWDLARTKTADKFFQGSVYKLGSFNPNKHYKWPLPQVALDRNTNLVQNPSY
jgi:hypothetical protein